MRKRADRSERQGKMRDLFAVAEAFKGFKPAYEALKVVRAVPTRFVQVDHATGVKGLPIERFMLIHGPSGEGKTYFSLGLLDSFLMRDHFADLIDAERTTPITWPERVMRERARHPFFFADRPESYEKTVQHVRDFLHCVKEQRDQNRVDPDTSALVVCDSIRKLVPEKMWEKLMKSIKENGLDGAGGRAGQIKAAMNAQWMDELIPLLEETQTAFIAIARETEAPSTSGFGGPQVKVGGGAAIYYDASMVFRVERVGYVTEKAGKDLKDGEKANVFGERHRVTIRKTKVAGHEDRQTICYFHTSNGKWTPFGFDRARDVLELAERFKMVDVGGGGWLSLVDDGTKLGQGRHNVVKMLTAEPDRLERLESMVRERFDNEEATEVDADGVVQ